MALRSLSISWELIPLSISGLPQSISTAGGTVNLNFGLIGSQNVEIIEGSVSLNIDNFLTLSGDFGFEQFTDPTSNLTEILVGGKNISAVLGGDTTNLSVTDASFGLVVVPGSGSNPANYALYADGGTDSLNGIPGLALTANNLTVKYISAGMIASALTNATAQLVPTPDGGVPLDFSNLATGHALTQIEGQVSLSIANFVSISGDFIFQSSSGQGFTIAGDNIDATLGTSQINLTVTGASFGVEVVPGTNGKAGAYALYATGGTDTLNGIPGLILTSNGLTVQVNTGVSSPSSITTPDNTVINLPTTIGKTEVEGSISLSIDNSITVSGNFSFIEKPDVANPQISEILVGASGVTAFVGTPDQTIGVEITGAEMGLVIYNNQSTNTSSFALYASATLTLVLPSGVDFGLTGNLTLQVNNTGQAVNQAVSTPGTNTTSGTTVQVNFPTAANILSLSGTGVVLSVGPQGSPYFTVSGNFGVSEVTNGTTTEVLIGATNVSSTSAITPSWRERC